VPTVLLLHGFPQTSLAWRSVTGPLREAGYDVVAPDLSGGDLVDQVRSRLDEPVHLVGHDIGGLAAWRVAAAWPDRVRTLTSVAAPHPRAFQRASAGEGGSDQAQRSFYLDHFRQPAALELFLADDGAGLRRLFDVAGHTGDVDAHVEAMLVPGALDRALGWYRADHPADVADVAVPTLLVWGDADPVVSPEAARFSGDHVSGPYRFEVLQGAGHWIPELDAGRLVPLLLEHVA
jgi:pimeloyl-ACP methyl ester carboxylesterase